MITKDFVIENNIDNLCLTETWLNTNDPRDELAINEITKCSINTNLSITVHIKTNTYWILLSLDPLIVSSVIFLFEIQ